ncbi:MAG: hypothetical protein K1X53_15935 [Candidatus Sumerlaeaceae bacterium]|nr:hypothetical protein [Candidatus Sumerlaeaceae bacterium]
MDKPFYKKLWAAWTSLGHTISHYLTVLIAAILYVVAFAPLAIFMKLRGRKFLPHFNGSESTYFLPKDQPEPTMERMKRQW